MHRREGGRERGSFTLPADGHGLLPQLSDAPSVGRSIAWAWNAPKRPRSRVRRFGLPPPWSRLEASQVALWGRSSLLAPGQASRAGPGVSLGRAGMAWSLGCGQNLAHGPGAGWADRYLGSPPGPRSPRQFHLREGFAFLGEPSGLALDAFAPRDPTRGELQPIDLEKPEPGMYR